jgi:hypothetical protein
MRKRVWIPLVVVLAVCVLLLLKTNQYRRGAPPEPRAGLTDQPIRPEQPADVDNRRVTNTSGAAGVAQAAAAPKGTAGESGITNLQALAEWQAPIEFYGKVVDENTNAVAGASIHFRWSEIPAEDGMRTADTQSDSAGLFSLHGKRGRSLTVWFGKDGYYSSNGGQETFLYALGPNIYSPDLRNPVLFEVKKKGIPEPVSQTDFPVGMGQIAQLHHDGTPVELDLLKAAQVPAGNGQLRLEFWRDISNRKARVFDWKLQLSVPGGGLVEAPEEFAFQAPESGYQPSIVIDMPVTNQNWRSDIRSKSYIQLPDGRYGRIDVYLLSDNGVFTVHSVVNPSGSRNLEPAN